MLFSHVSARGVKREYGCKGRVVFVYRCVSNMSVFGCENVYVSSFNIILIFYVLAKVQLSWKRLSFSTVILRSDKLNSGCGDTL